MAPEGNRPVVVRAKLVRPDDLLNLRVEGVNLRLDAGDPAAPALVVDDPQRDAFLVVVFPPQTITEENVFESSPLPVPKHDRPKENATAPGIKTPGGRARARIGGESRLVFRVPPERRIPYSIAGLLDWRELDLHVSPLADVPPEPSAAEIAAAPGISAPGPLDTALELPYRLVISPAGGVAWDHVATAAHHAGRAELWHTRMAHRDGAGGLVPLSRAQPAPLRAIWSPDYNPAKFDKTDPPRLMQPDQDWDNPPGVLTAMAPSDRHEIVVLTSAFHGFIKGFADDGKSIDHSAFVPAPVYADELFLSPLGGWLRSRGQWRPPMPWRIRRRQVLEPAERRFDRLVDDAIRLRRPNGLAGAPGAEPRAGASFDPPVPALTELFTEPLGEALAGPVARAEIGVDELRPLEDIDWFHDLELLGEPGASLNVSEWVHRASQGRDHYVRIVYEGFVHCPRHRAALVKVTERKICDGADGKPIAYLVQRMFVVIRQPVMDYSGEAASDARFGRHMPLRRIRLTTLITPDIDPPEPIAGDLSFLIKVGGKPFRFNAIVEGPTGTSVDTTLTLVFVPFSDVKQPGVIHAVRTSQLTDIEARTCPVPGQPVTFAVPDPAATTDNTTLVTHELHLTTEDQGSGDSYTFRPVLFKAGVRLPAVEQLLGRDAPAQIAFDPDYLDKGFDGDNHTGLFARLVKEDVAGTITPAKVQAPFAADQAGGVATPNLSVSGLTRQLGPVAGDDLAKVAQNGFDPADFFNDVKSAAKLFGTISLIDLLLGGPMDTDAPTVQMTTEPVAGAPNQRRLVATFRWRPKVQAASVGIVSLDVNAGTAFTIDGRVERIVEIPPSGTPGPTSSLFQGELVNFSVDLLRVVAVHFTTFRFTSESGRKPDINVVLEDPPVTFEGELEFVNELQHHIPPGLFGDGASLDVSPTRVRAGFGIGLPPLAVGVFALEGVALNAAVELPFLDGKPLFEFGISSREHPFCLTVAFLGGGGFFHLQLDTGGIRLLEAALEFGAAASIDLGVASGGVHIMAGIYFAMGNKDGKDLSVLSGYLRLGGELSVLGLISISLEFVLSFGYENGKAAGRATLTVKVEVAFFSTSVDITVEKKFGGSSGDPRFLDVFETPAVWDEYASAFA
jgi:hypothetical protein